MSIKNSLEKAAAIFGTPNEPKCVFMTEETKGKIINENTCGITNRYALSYLDYAKSYLESKSIDITGFKFDAFSNILSVEFDVGVGRSLININSDSKNDIEEIIDASIEDVEPFDITNYKFTDSGIEYCEIGAGVLTIYNPELTTNLVKNDAIAIARALGVTGEDLK